MNVALLRPLPSSAPHRGLAHGSLPKHRAHLRAGLQVRSAEAPEHRAGPQPSLLLPISLFTPEGLGPGAHPAGPIGVRE